MAAVTLLFQKCFAALGHARDGVEGWLRGWTLQHACSCPRGTVFGADVCARGIFREARCRHPFGNAEKRKE